MRKLAGWLTTLVLACGGKETAPSKPIEIATVTCPEGSTFDTARGFCIATPPPTLPVIKDPPPPPLAKDAGAQTVAVVQPDDAGVLGPSVGPVAAAVSGNVIVSCDFPDGWVSLMPVAAYPKDDSYLMQSLIGLTEDPKFWNGAGYATLAPYKAKKCPRTGVGFNLASSGDYWILAGQANTFGAKGKYDKNGVRKKQTFAIGTTPIAIKLAPADLVFTWNCISCPWIVAPGIDAFTVLRERDDRKKRGTDRVPLHGLMVERNKVRIRVAERERETTHLAEMRLVVGGKTIVPTARALAADDDLDVVMESGSEIVVEFPVQDGSGPIDAELIVTGWYEPELQPWVVDLHVDLPWSSFAKKDLGDLSADRLARGNVRTMIVPLFVEDAWKADPASVRKAYGATFAALGAVIRGNVAKTTVATRIAFEGADGFADDPGAIDPWLAQKNGACFVGLVHSHSNALGGASQDPDKAKRALGLTPKGRLLAARIVERGGILDLAHASDAAQVELAAIGKGHPIVDTHTGMRALVNIDRNLSDENARLVAASGGVIGISLHSGHVGSRAGEPATLEEYADHVEHAAKVAGFDHVAIGSDLAGAIRPPSDADGAATWPWLASILRDRGWTSAQIHALFHGNAERVLARCGNNDNDDNNNAAQPQ